MLIPRTLFGRTVLIFSLGIIVAQLLALALTLFDRERAERRALQSQVAVQLSAIIQAMDAVDEPARQKIIQAMQSRFLKLEVLDTPKIIEPQTDSIHANNIELQKSAELLAASMKESLGENRNMMVNVSEIDSAHLEKLKRRQAQSGKTKPLSQKKIEKHLRKINGFQIQIQLLDGKWLSLTRAQPNNLLRLPYALLTSLITVLLAVIALSLIAVRAITKPLDELAEGVEKFGLDIQQKPLNINGPYEIQKVTQSFNTMADRLRRFIQERSQALTAISHDLKTPITRLRLRTELLTDAALKKKFTDDLIDMEQMVQSTLGYIRGTDDSEASQPIDMNALLESIQQDIEQLGYPVILESTPLQAYAGKPLALKRCLTNVIENAVRYGKKAHISFEESLETLTIRIEDEGPGIPESEYENVFMPFYRLDPARQRHAGGSGLGLSIARNIARAHGGDVTLGSGENGGLKVTITLSKKQ